MSDNAGAMVQADDLVAAVMRGAMGADQAEAEFTRRIQSWSGSEDDLAGFLRHVGMSDREYTAYGHGASLSEIGLLRSHGWPKACSNCRSTIHYEEGFWLQTPQDVRCIHCPVHAAADVVPWSG